MRPLGAEMTKSMPTMFEQAMQMDAKEQAAALLAFMTAFDELTGQWPRVEGIMREEWGIEDPETTLEEAREALQ